MAKEGSVAPKERVNITYKPATGDAKEQVELPFKILMMGDYTGRTDDRPLEDRKPINVDKDSFNQVMAEQRLEVQADVADRLSGEADAELSVKLEFRSLADFTPDGIVEQVPELRKLMELRGALTALKGPLGNVPAFRRKLQALLNDESSRKRLMAELSIDEKHGE